MRARDYFLYAVLLASALAGILISGYGMPYTLHPDESYLIKHPFKCIVNYSHMEFVAPMNLYGWLLSAWYVLVYLAGFLFSAWHSLAEFQNLITIEAGSIIFAGRLLSVLLVLIAHYVTYKLLRKLIADRSLLVMVFLLFVFNPVLLTTVYWVKFEAISYFFAVIFLSRFYGYFVDGTTRRVTVYALCIAALSVRIEMLSFFACLLLLDYLKRKKEDLPFFERSLAWSGLAGAGIFTAVTFYPFVLLYQAPAPGAEFMPLTSDKSFEGVIVRGVTAQLSSPAFYKELFSGLVYYGKLSLAALGIIPLLALLPLPRRAVNRNTLFYYRSALYLYIAGFFGVIILFPNRTTHYFLTISLVMLMAAATYLASATRRAKGLALFSLLFVATFVLSFLYAVCFVTDTRLEARNFLLRSSSQNDLLAIETISVNGSNPLISEMPEDLRQKAGLVKKYRLGTGQYYEVRSRLDSSESRPIMDIFSDDYYIGTEGEGKWINTYKREDFLARAPRYYVTNKRLDDPRTAARSDFYAGVLQNYRLVKTFEFKPADMRLAFLVSTEPYYTGMYVYEKK
jgi:hypothetical protein